MKPKKNNMINRDNPDKRAVSYLNTPRLTVFILIAAIILSIVTAVWTKDKTTRKLHGEAIERLNTYNSYLLDKVGTYIAFSKVMAERPYVMGYLKHPGDQNTMNDFLLQYNDSIGASIVYIINKAGVVVGTSNYKNTDSLAGKDLSFRDYFKKALMGSPDEDIAIGTTTKKLGYYRSYPVRDDVSGEILGVTAIKYDANIFSPQNTNSKEIALIADDDGVIFNTSDKRYLYHTLHKLPEDVLQKIRHDKLYADEPLLPLPIIRESKKDGMKFVTIRHSEQSQTGKGYTDTEFMMVGTQDNATVWNLHLLVELSDVGVAVKKNIVYILLLMFICYLIGIFMIHRDKSRKDLLESYNDLLVQMAIVDKHVTEQEIINSVLKLSLSSEPIELHLQRKLDVILEHLSQPKGCIFLYNEALKVLQIAAHRGFSDEQLAQCSAVPIGQCLCGLAASTKEVVFSSNGKEDARHTTTHDGMSDHGHYCVPIVSTDKQTDRVLGVINVYVDAGYERNDDDELFIKNMAHVIAGVILRKQELQLIELDRTESLTTLAAGIAHEINNPLSFIKTSVSSFQKNLAKVEHFIRHTLLSQELSSSEQTESSHKKNILDAISMMNTKINSSNKGIERIMEIVNGLRTFTRLNKTNIEELDMNKCIDEALSMRINKDSEVMIVREYGQLPPYLCESRSMNQCFYHIIDNAVQAVNDVGTIRVVTAITGVEGELIQIRIEDDGVGMSEDAVKQAFVPFFTTKEVGSGKGLGLAMVDGIIKRHGGKVSIESAEGKGTAITILLPLMQNKMFYN
ncbi:MAG: GAF domain-containing protein [Nitrospirae bacterium]|nr:GAF domain-containing protein [Nitrospirota bacterium]